MPRECHGPRRQKLGGLARRPRSTHSELIAAHLATGAIKEQAQCSLTGTARWRAARSHAGGRHAAPGPSARSLVSGLPPFLPDCPRAHLPADVRPSMSSGLCMCVCVCVQVPYVCQCLTAAIPMLPPQPHGAPSPRHGMGRDGMGYVTAACGSYLHPYNKFTQSYVKCYVKNI